MKLQVCIKFALFKEKSFRSQVELDKKVELTCAIKGQRDFFLVSS